MDFRQGDRIGRAGPREDAVYGHPPVTGEILRQKKW